MVHQGRRVRRRDPRALSANLRGRRRGERFRIGSARPKARLRSSSCSTSFRATCSAASARAFAADPLARASCRARASRAASTGECRRPSGSSSICRSSIPRSWPTRSAAVALFRATGDADIAEMGRAARRHHPPVRPLPASQRRARPRHHAGGAGLSRRRRLRGLAPNSRIAGTWTLTPKPALNTAQSDGGDCSCRCRSRPYFRGAADRRRGTCRHARFAQMELKIIAPAAPGGGWDQTARSMQQALIAAGSSRRACR